jgi:hypothetical protein
LLKSMLQQLSDQAHPLAPILKSLLLPHDGLNLRNLLWHGFLSNLPRRWLSLSVVLLYNLELDQEAVDETSVPLPNLRSHGSVQHLLEEHPFVIDVDASHSRSWLPASHQPLFDLAIAMRNSYPACTAALLGILLEHGLRLDWCTVNHSPDDRSARAHSYYVTLDGHGQRLQHDLILHPYRNSGERNKVVSHLLDGGTTALLTDLFASSCGGPNIRAALAHGSWDTYTEKELCSMTTGKTNISSQEKGRLQDIVEIMLIAFKAVASRDTICYRPLFTYTATTTRDIQAALSQLSRLEAIMTKSSLETSSASVPDAAFQLKVSLEHLRMSASALPFVESYADKWTSNRLFQEHESNVVLADCIAVKSLLTDIANATESYATSLEEGLVDLSSDNVSSRHRKRARRMLSMADVTLGLYSFTTQVALLFLRRKIMATTAAHDEKESIFVKAVERCRMCVSTFVTFLPKNSDRAIKAAVEFTKGKAIKAVLAELLKHE